MQRYQKVESGAHTGTVSKPMLYRKKMRQSPTRLFVVAMPFLLIALIWNVVILMTQEPLGAGSQAGGDSADTAIAGNMAAAWMPGTAAGDWQLLLVNPGNSMTHDYTVALTQLKNGHAIDERAYPDLQEMMDDCRAAGFSPVICSSYRTWEEQESLLNNQVDQYLIQGYAQDEARALAETIIAVPGTSEHQLGLALDIVDENNQLLDESQANTAVQQWLMQNSWQYGFILRYPQDKSYITGIIYEPWHYRYVGREHAQKIYEADICLEEYLSGILN